MLLKLFILYLLLNISLNVCGLMAKKSFTPGRGHQLLESIVKLTDSLIEVTPYLNSTLSEIPSNCVQMLCKFICFNGISTDIELDILMVSQKNKYLCSRIDELRLYNYDFPDGQLHHGFLGKYSDKLAIIYIASSNITDVDAGAFANGTFKEIYFENLQLQELRKDFFMGLSHNFITLSIIQKQMPIKRIDTNFLCNVKYSIKSLTVQAGLKSVGNLTGGDFLLNNLAYSDFSYNDFGSQIEYTAFSKVSLLEWLDLSHSNLEYLPAYLFADCIAALAYLNLSHNKLKTISRLVFGWREIPRDLEIFAAGNEWSCSCDLQQQIRHIILHQRTLLVCSEPAVYKGLSVFDDQICGEKINSLERNQEETTKSSQEESHKISTVVDSHEPNTETQFIKPAISSTSLDGPVYKLPTNCFTNESRNESRAALMRWPLTMFNLIPRKGHFINVVVVNSRDTPFKSLSLIWFSKTTSKYSKSEINFKEYDLGCLKNISVVTTVRNLLPNTSYTFCLVLRKPLTVSPFSCQSIHVSNNLATPNSVWLSRDMRMAALSLLAIGVAAFSFTGISMMYFLLKHKPIMLKGSKRVATLKSSTEKIVVLPQNKSVRFGKGNEELQASNGPCTNSQQRRKSHDSVASYESYINVNLYEVIPAFEKLHNKTCSFGLANKPVQQTTLADINTQGMESSYLTPLESKNLVQCAEIPHRTKRNSHGALPQLPTHPTPQSVSLRELQNKPAYAQIGNVCFLDSQV